MGGGYGRPFFNTVVQRRKYPADTTAMTIKCSEAVRGLEGIKILATHARRLPMPDCSMPDRCRCRFQKYTDRRDDEQGRRFRFGGERAAWYNGSQRRKSPGRRTAD